MGNVRWVIVFGGSAGGGSNCWRAMGMTLGQFVDGQGLGKSLNAHLSGEKIIRKQHCLMKGERGDNHITHAREALYV